MTRLNLFNTNQSINQSFVSTMLTSELGQLRSSTWLTDSGDMNRNVGTCAMCSALVSVPHGGTYTYSVSTVAYIINTTSIKLMTLPSTHCCGVNVAAAICRERLHGPMLYQYPAPSVTTFVTRSTE